MNDENIENEVTTMTKTLYDPEVEKEEQKREEEREQKKELILLKRYLNQLAKEKQQVIYQKYVRYQKRKLKKFQIKEQEQFQGPRDFKIFQWQAYVKA